MSQHQNLVDYLISQKEISGMSLAEMSRQIGLNDRQLSNIINGVVPGLKVCRQLAEFFNVSLDYMLFMAGRLEDPLDEYDSEVRRVAHMVNSIRDEESRQQAVRVVAAVLETFLKEEGRKRKKKK